MDRVRIGAWSSLAATIALSALMFHLPLTHATPPGRAYQVELLVSDDTDAELVNGWGLAAGVTGPWMVSVNRMQLGKTYDETGALLPPRVAVPGRPTGVAHNGGTGFVVSNGTVSAPARFLFASDNGTISGYSPEVTPGPEGQAIVVVDRSAAGAVYKGLALAVTSSGERLYATDFRNGRVDSFDRNFAPVIVPGGFMDPKLPEGFAPFGIRTLAGRIFVTYAKQDVTGLQHVSGRTLGVVNVFDLDGRLIARVAQRGQLNAPWGLAIAPAGFGDLAGDLLVGNHGSGEILALSMTDDMQQFTPKGVLRDASNAPIQIEGLWGISFGNGDDAGPANLLYFTAGPEDETGGAFGRIVPVQ